MSPNQALVVVAEQLVEVAQGLFGGGAPGLRACPVLAVQLREAARDGVLDSSRLVGAGACGQFRTSATVRWLLILRLMVEGYRPAGRPSIPDINSGSSASRQDARRADSIRRSLHSAPRFAIAAACPGVNRRTSRTQTRNSWVGWIRCRLPVMPRLTAAVLPGHRVVAAPPTGPKCRRRLAAARRTPYSPAPFPTGGW